jgi:hypothetical protein
VYVSFDDGDHWQSLRVNMPATSIRDLVIKDDDLVVGTHGRSIWILDDLTPLREWSKAIEAKAAHLFGARPALRWQLESAVSSHTKGPGENPPAGAIVYYWLKDEPKDVVLGCSTRKALVRTLSSRKLGRRFPRTIPTPEPAPSRCRRKPGCSGRCGTCATRARRRSRAPRSTRGIRASGRWCCRAATRCA